MHGTDVAVTTGHPAAAAVVAAPTARLFDRLDATSKERVTVLVSKAQALLPIERDAFVQELQWQLAAAERADAEADSTNGKLARYTSPRLEAVRSRDPAFVVTRAGGATTATTKASEMMPQAPLSSTAQPISLESLMGTPGMFGETDVVLRKDKMSLYDKLHQSVADLTGAPRDGSAAGAGAGAAVGSRTSLMEPSSYSRGMVELVRRSHGSVDSLVDRRSSAGLPSCAMTPGVPPTAAVGTPASVSKPCRSNAYQAVRLAMSSPAYIAAQPPTSMTDVQKGYDGVRTILNVTGMPINEEDLQEWFDELDEEGRGTLKLEDFHAHMRALDRDFGVPAGEAAREKDAAQLAFDGRLNFEAFAYLVLRYPRV